MNKENDELSRILNDRSDDINEILINNKQEKSNDSKKESYNKSIYRKIYHEDDSERVAYSQDASNISLKPKYVVFPEKEEEVKEIINYCNENQISLCARGAGTNLVGNSISNELIVDLSRMNKVIELDVKNKTIIVEPGIVCKRLNEFLMRESNLFFPVIPSSHKVCTIGGMISCNAAGNWAIRFGKMDSWIESVEFFDGLGERHRIDDQERIKDVLVGKEGLTGVITQVKLRLIDRFETKIDSLFSSDLDLIMKKVNELKENKDVIALEFLNNVASKIIFDNDSFCLIIESRINEEFRENFDDQRLTKEEIKKGKEIMEKREKSYPMVAKLGYIMIEDPVIKEEYLREFLDFFDENEIPCFGHIGVNILHPCFKREQEELIDELYKRIKDKNLSISGEHGIGIKKVSYANKEFIEKIIELKKEFDPMLIFNRFFYDELIKRS